MKMVKATDNVHPCVPEKIIGTLTSSILKSMYTSISPIFSYKLYSVATLGHPEPLQLKNHVRIVALTSNLQRVSFCSVTDFLYYSSTTELIPSLILIKETYPNSKVSLRCRESLSALLLLWRADSRIKARADFWLVPNYPASPRIITT